MATNHWNISILTGALKSLVWSAPVEKVSNARPVLLNDLNGLNVLNCFRVARRSSVTKQMSLFQRPVRFTPRAKQGASLFFLRCWWAGAWISSPRLPHYQGKPLDRHRFLYGRWLRPMGAPRGAFYR